MATLEEWHPAAGKMGGKIDGKKTFTSLVLSRDGFRAVFTKSGSRYELGEPLIKGKREEWLRDLPDENGLILQNWRYNEQGCITGEAYGKQAQNPGETITTAPIASREGFHAVVTTDGTKYQIGHFHSAILSPNDWLESLPDNSAPKPEAPGL